VANSFDSNVTRQLARVFLEEAEASRVLTKTVDTQLLSGRFSPRSGTTVDFKRPHDYFTHRDATGDISSNKNDIVSGKATGTVQNFFTVAMEWTSVDEALKFDQLERVIAPAATRIITDLELDLANYMTTNGGFSFGAPGTAVDAWSDVAGAMAKAKAMGIPGDEIYYVMNPYVQASLADKQSALASGKTGLVDSAWEKSQISSNFAGANVMVSNALKSITLATAADRAGAITATAVDATYATHKDTMIQTIEVDGVTNNAAFKAGEIVEVTGKFQRSLATRETMYDNSGAGVKWRGTLTADATANGSGVVTITVAGPAIFESGGQYNTVSAALADNDIITFLGTSAATVQPSLLYHKQAFGLGSVKLPKLYSTDTVATTEDGMSIRVSKYADGDTNKQMVRFDLLPAYATFNPFYGGQCYGV
jgi:hypothetical protein